MQKLSAVIGALIAYASFAAGDGGREVVAKEYGHEWLLDDVSFTDDGKIDAQILFGYLVSDARTHFAQEHHLEVTPAAYQRCLAGYERSAQHNAKYPSALNAEVEKQAKDEVLNHEIERALYKLYGGTLLVSGDGYSAIGANIALLAAEEKAKRVSFATPAIRTQVLDVFAGGAGDVGADAKRREDFETLAPGCERLPAADPQVLQPLATVFGREIYLEELASHALRQRQERTDKQGYPAWLKEREADSLLSVVLNEARAAYAKEHHIEVTPAENQACREGLQRIGIYRLDDKPELRAFGEAMAQGMMETWKVDTAIFKEHGGRLIFQQSGLEPIDAHKKLLDGYEAKKKFSFATPELRAATLGYFAKRFTDITNTDSRKDWEARPMCQQKPK